MCCIDGGISAGIRLSGSGILLTEELLEVHIKTNNIEQLTTHDGCGAFAKAHPGVIDRNVSAHQWGAAIAERLQLEHHHISGEHMCRSPYFHNETVIYFDCTNRFIRTDDFPLGYVISRKNNLFAAEDLDLALQIALSADGYGDRFSFLAPLHIIIIPHPYRGDLSYELMKQEIQQVTAQYNQNNISITGFETAQLLGR